MSDSQQVCSIRIPAAFLPYLEATIIRHGYIRPSAVATVEKDVVNLTISADANVSEERSAFLHLLYRERIYAETLELREAVLAAARR